MSFISTQHSWLRPSWRDTALIGLCLFGLVFSLALLGSATRRYDMLATFWPADAVILGLFLRRRDWGARPAFWLAVALAYLAAELIQHSPVPVSLLLTMANLLCVGVAYRLMTRSAHIDLSLRRPQAILALVAYCALASGVSALPGGLAHQLHTGQALPLTALSWLVTGVVSYTAILPVLLTAPALPVQRLRRYWHEPQTRTLADLAPAALLIFSCVLSLLIGGPGSLAFPVLPLLWCALSYPLFATALLTCFYSIWTLFAVTQPLAGVLPDNWSAPLDLLSVRMGIASIALAPITAACIMAARNEAVEKLQRLALYDALTGMLNKLTFQQQGQALLTRCRISRQPTSVLLLDIDHFKPVNDTHGHHAGDQALVEVAQRIRTVLRDSDLCGRLGGEEFGVLLPDCGPAQAHAVAERVRQSIARSPVMLDDGQELTLTASLGVATQGPDTPDLRSLLRQADTALYQAKHAGRDRSHSFGWPETDPHT
ncbi:MAG TPA: diguanylate cyclase [Alcaligenes sp.]|nr:diguanylate cyclase [Alcaligenes sp.]HRL27480.1 diguanylate cyclase [Alcaligenes sp.]